MLPSPDICFEFRECELDRIEVRRVTGQKFTSHSTVGLVNGRKITEHQRLADHSSIMSQIARAW